MREDPSVLDVTEPSHFTLLKKLIEKHDITLVLVWADYCGHCGVYKDKVWNKLKAIKGKKAGLASIHYDQVEKSPLSGAKYKGYPSVIQVMKNGKMKVLKDEDGKPTNSMTTDAANNVALMTGLVKKGNAGAGIGAAAGAAAVAAANAMADIGKKSATPDFADEANEIRNSTTHSDAENTIENIPAELNYAHPPDPEDDQLPTAGKGVAVGGGMGLYDYLVSIGSKKPAPKRRTKRSKSSRRKSRRRS